MTAASSLRSRRGLLLGYRCSTPEPLRPPWAWLDRFAHACTRCDACLHACPAGILAHDSEGLPTVDFGRGECTFCGACAEICPEPVFDRAASSAWAVQAQVGDRCLAQRGSVCQSCRDACPVGAIRFRPMLGRVAVPEIGLDACTGCGACVAPCPVAAIEVAAPVVPHAV